MSSLSVEPLAPRHHAAWLDFWRAYQAFYKVDLSDVVSSTTWARLQDSEEPVHGAMAIEAGRPIGFVHWITHRSCWTTGDYCYLQDLFVAAEARRMGAGRILIEHVYSQAERAGCSRVYWLTHETNTSAMKLYDTLADRSGFIQYRKQLG